MATYIDSPIQQLLPQNTNEIIPVSNDPMMMPQQMLPQEISPLNAVVPTGNPMDYMAQLPYQAPIVPVAPTLPIAPPQNYFQLHGGNEVSDLSQLEGTAEDALNRTPASLSERTYEQRKQLQSDILGSGKNEVPDKKLGTGSRGLVRKNVVSPSEVGAAYDKAATDQGAMGEAPNYVIGQDQQGKDIKILDEINKTRRQLGDLYSNSKDLPDIKGDYWQNAPTWSKIMAGIGLGLSAFGGPQSAANAVGIINGAIDRDIKLQLMNREKLKEKNLRGIGQKQTELDRLITQFGDVNKAVYAKKALDYQRVKDKMNSMIQAGQLTSPQAAQSAALIEAKIREANMRLDEYVGKKVSEQTEREATAEGAPPLTRDQVNKLSPEAKKRWVPQFNGLASTIEDAKEMKERLIPASSMIKDFDTLISATHSSVMHPEQVASKHFGRAKSAINKAVATLRGLNRFDFVGTGVISKEDWNVLNNIFVDPTRVFSIDANQRESLLRVRNGIINRTLEKAKESGLGAAPSYLFKKPPTTWDWSYFQTKE